MGIMYGNTVGDDMNYLNYKPRWQLVFTELTKRLPKIFSDCMIVSTFKLLSSVFYVFELNVNQME
jgi:hypothetical protein